MFMNRDEWYGQWDKHRQGQRQTHDKKLLNQLQHDTTRVVDGLRALLDDVMMAV